MKKVLLISTVLFSFCFIYSQNADSQKNVEEEIELPDVTTIISGGSLTAGKDSVPDYRKILPDSKTGAFLLPKLDDINEEDVAANIEVPSSTKEQSVFAEGKIGGGYPFSFLGDFSVYRTTGNSPFEIKFAHKNEEGFGGKSSSDGYFYRNTSIEAEKEFINKKSNYKLSGWYKNLNEGFQLKSQSYTDYLCNSIGGDMLASWNFTSGVYIKTDADVSFYNRYGTKFNGSAVPAAEYEKNARLFAFMPELKIGWTDSVFDIALNVKYETQLNLKDSNTLEKAPEASSAEAGHRGRFTVNFAWQEDTVRIFADAGLAVGNSIGGQKVLFPFSLGAQFEFPYSLSSRVISLGVQGGLKSQWQLAEKIEQENSFAVLACLPSEQSDWYGLVTVVLPIKEIFTLSVDTEYKKTAFDNGVWAADYNDSTSLSGSGFYFIKQINRTELNTNVEFDAVLKMFKLTGEWKAYWMDVPSYDDRQSVKASVLIEGEKAKWNAGASIKEYIGSNADAVPEIGVVSSVKASPSIRLALEADDIIKLVTRKTRDFCHSQYKKNSGHVTALVKFQF